MEILLVVLTKEEAEVTITKVRQILIAIIVESLGLELQTADSNK